MFLASQGKEAMEQAVEDYPELAKYCLPNETYYDKSLGYYGSIVESTKGNSSSSVLDSSHRPGNNCFGSLPSPSRPPSRPSSQPLPRPSTLPQDPAKASATFGPTDRYVAALNCVTTPQLSDLSYPTYKNSDLVLAPPDDVQHDDLQKLLASHGYDDHGHCDVDNNYDTAEHFCRLCHVSGQPPSIFYSHNLLHPQCPSNFSDDDQEGD